jgi:IS605 OrfB family transposase
MLEACRFVYNKVLEWVNGGESNLFELKRRLPKLKEEDPWLRKAYSQSLQNEVLRVFKNLRVLSVLKRNGRKVGRLRFKGKGWFKSFAYPQFGFRLERGKLFLSKVGAIPIKEFCRKKKGSKNREKARVRLAKAYEKLVNQRNDFLHKLSRFYVENYDLIAVERLNISGMARNRRLGGKILDASWGKFLRMLSYKAERAGRRVVEVDPRGTSQNLPEGLDRDYVAACRILSLGLGRPEVTPVEMGPLLCVPASAVVAGQAPSLNQEAHTL